MNTFTTLITSKIGESRGVARIWLEGQKLLRAGVVIGTRYSIRIDHPVRQFELIPLASMDAVDHVFTVSKRERYGVVAPLLEIRTAMIRQHFADAQKVRVVIRLGRILITPLHKDKRVEERISHLEYKLCNDIPLSVCSLFHGGGVLDRAIHTGLMRSGIESRIRIGVELKGSYLDASLRNNPMLWNEESVALCADVRDVHRGEETPHCDLVVAGIPCTGASRSGKAKNKLAATEAHSSAGALFCDFLDFVRFANPAMAIVENVPDYLTSTSMMVIRAVLSSLGYRLFEGVLEGNAYGALENRSRMVIVAYTEGISGMFNLDDIVPVRRKEACLQDILEDIELDDPRWKTYDYLGEKEVRDLADGKNFQRQLLGPDSTYCGCIGRGYSKARSTEPFIQHEEEPALSRLLTVREHARVKTIPVEMVDGVSDTTAHEILGQSVIFAAFEAVGAAVGRLLKRSFEFSKKHQIAE